jgi:hypothetical protein
VHCEFTPQSVVLYRSNDDLNRSYTKHKYIIVFVVILKIRIHSLFARNAALKGSKRRAKESYPKVTYTEAASLDRFIETVRRPIKVIKATKSINETRVERSCNRRCLNRRIKGITIEQKEGLVTDLLQTSYKYHWFKRVQQTNCVELRHD